MTLNWSELSEDSMGWASAPLEDKES